MPSQYCENCEAQARRIEQLEAQLAERDKFIVSKGLWNEFVDQLPAALESKS